MIADRADGLELVHCVEGASLLAEAAFARDDLAQGVSWLARALRWTGDLNPAMKSRTLPALVRLFAVAIDHGDTELRQAGSALAKLRRFGRVIVIGRSAACLCEARLHARSGRLRRANACARKAVDEAIHLAMPADALAALEFLGSAETGQRDQFDQMLDAARSPWIDVLHRDEDAPGLPLVVSASRHQRGRQ